MIFLACSVVGAVLRQLALLDEAEPKKAAVAPPAAAVVTSGLASFSLKGKVAVITG
jgi:hypothetical protein